MRYSARLHMFDEYPHWRLICEGTILLIEPEVCGVQVYDQRCRASAIFLQNVGIRLDRKILANILGYKSKVIHTVWLWLRNLGDSIICNYTGRSEPNAACPLTATEKLARPITTRAICCSRRAIRHANSIARRRIGWEYG